MFKSLFKSLKFTIAFIIMLIVIIVLTVLLISFLPKKGDDGGNIQHSQIETFPETESDSTSEEPEPLTAKAPRNLTSIDSHVIPFMDEEIAENGSLKINDEMETKGGLVFHKRPVFDPAETDGNQIYYRGTYPIIGKLFVMYQEKPTIMYHTQEGYYVTSNPQFVTYEASVREVNMEPQKVTTFGYNDSYGLILTVFADDGNHLIFSLSTFDGAETVDILKNVVAKYDAFGTASFEYGLEEAVQDGQIKFKKDNGMISGVTVSFKEQVALGTIQVKELTLSK